MAEIEINVMAGQCLEQRIDNIETVSSEVSAWQMCRDNLQAKVNWQFTIQDDRIKPKRRSCAKSLARHAAMGGGDE